MSLMLKRSAIKKVLLAKVSYNTRTLHSWIEINIRIHFYLEFELQGSAHELSLKDNIWRLLRNKKGSRKFHFRNKLHTQFDILYYSKKWVHLISKLAKNILSRSQWNVQWMFDPLLLYTFKFLQLAEFSWGINFLKFCKLFHSCWIKNHMLHTLVCSMWYTLLCGASVKPFVHKLSCAVTT